MLRHTMFKSIKSIRLCDACLHTANTRDNKSERFPSIDAPINNPPFSILNYSHFSLLKRLAAPFIWELTYNREVNQNEGLSVLMTQGSPREVVPFNPPPQKNPPSPRDIFLGTLSVMTQSFCWSHLPRNILIPISVISNEQCKYCPLLATSLYQM